MMPRTDPTTAAEASRASVNKDVNSATRMERMPSPGAAETEQPTNPAYAAELCFRRGEVLGRRSARRPRRRGIDCKGNRVRLSLLEHRYFERPSRARRFGIRPL